MRRKDLVQDTDIQKLKSSQVTESRQLNSKDLWTKCALSGESLVDPILSDYLGRLYNKESILEWLLSPETYNDAQRKFMKHITSLKDLVQLKPDYNSDNQWICSVSGKNIMKEYNSGSFIYFAECGHVFAESAIRNVSSKTCPDCDVQVDAANAVIINASTTEHLQKLEARLTKLNKNGTTHSLKKIKQRKRKKDQDQDQKSKTKTKKSKSDE